MNFHGLNQLYLFIIFNKAQQAGTIVVFLFTVFTRQFNNNIIIIKMKNFFPALKPILFCALLLQVYYGSAQTKNDEAKMSAFVTTLMSKMTLDEKIGQLNLVTMGRAITGSVVNSGVEERIKKGEFELLVFPTIPFLPREMPKEGAGMDESRPQVLARVEGILSSDGWLMGGTDLRASGKAPGF